MFSKHIYVHLCLMEKITDSVSVFMMRVCEKQDLMQTVSTVFKGLKAVESYS